MSHLDDMVLSEAQRTAVFDASPRVLVAAGAGSGKTSLLVAYFLHALLDEGVPVERLAAVTFTRKAAGELVARIRRELEACGRMDLVHALDSAVVGTIHSLCRLILRRHALEAGVDPAFTVLEADAADLLKREAAVRAWTEAVEAAGEEELSILARHEKTLRTELVALYDSLRGCGCEEPRVEIKGVEIASRGCPGDPLAALETSARSALDAGRSLARRTATMDKAFGAVEACLHWAGTVDVVHPRPGDLEQSSALFPGRISALECHLAPVREALTAYRCHLARNELERLVTAMNDLLGRFHEHYRRLKLKRGVLDFADLELRTKALLETNRSALPSILGSGFRLMVDEFQDTNELQCAVLERLGVARMLMVGDERQSIYRFRGADVDVFARREAELARVAEEAGVGSGGFHRLDTNYRSRAEVLAFINRLFSHDDFFGCRFVPLLCGVENKATTASETALSYGPAPVEPLSVAPLSATVPSDIPRPFAAVDVVAVDRRIEGAEDEQLLPIQAAEAQAVSDCITRLLAEEGREPRDVVVLMPALTHVDLYQQALQDRGIAFYLVRGKGYYSQEEIADVRALLQLLLDPRDDVVLATVLRSPFVHLSDDALYLLGREKAGTQAGSLWEIVERGGTVGVALADERRLRCLCDGLAGLRDRVGRPGMAGLIDEAIAVFDYDIRLLSSGESRRRYANLRKLMRLADEFESLHGPDLAGFVEVVTTMADVSDQEGSAATLAEGENVVRIMTIHQAKGLEFPAVILAGLGSDVRTGGHPAFVVDRNGRSGVFLKGSKRETYEDYDLCWGPAIEIVENEKKKERQEDVRLLYVAMTRAEERLILVGARPKGDKIEGCRLGRIVRALGLDTLPASGAEEPVVGLDAVVRGVALRTPSVEADDSGAHGGRSGAVLLTAGEAGCSTGDAGCSTGDVLTPDSGAEDPTLPVLLENEPRPPVPRSLSFSGLSFYLDCPRRFLLERMLGLRLDEAHGESDEAGEFGDDLQVDGNALLDGVEARAGREVGLLVHTLLERSDLVSAPPSLDTLRSLAAEIVNAAGAGCSFALLVPTQMHRALTLARAFWSSPVAARDGVARAQKEAPFFFLLRDDLLISGVMDLVWTEGNRCVIVDYKTNALGDRLVEEVATAYRLQGVLYSLAALYRGAEEVEMHFLFLECPQAPFILRYGAGDVPALEEEVETVLRPLRAGEYPASPGHACSSCAAAKACEHAQSSGVVP